MMTGMEISVFEKGEGLEPLWGAGCLQMEPS